MCSSRVCAGPFPSPPTSGGPTCSSPWAEPSARGSSTAWRSIGARTGFPIGRTSRTASLSGAAPPPWTSSLDATAPHTRSAGRGHLRRETEADACLHFWAARMMRCFSHGARTPRLRASAGRVQADRAAARTTGGGDTRAMRERDTQCCWDRADLMTGTTRLQVMIPDDDSFQSACLRRCWSVRGSAVCRCWAACVRRGASCRAWTSGGGCARGVRQRGRAGTVQPASRLASDCLRTADGPGSPLPDVNVVLTPGNP